MKKKKDTGGFCRICLTRFPNDRLVKSCESQRDGKLEIHQYCLGDTIVVDEGIYAAGEISPYPSWSELMGGVGVVLRKRSVEAVILERGYTKIAHHPFYQLRLLTKSHPGLPEKSKVLEEYVSNGNCKTTDR